ncbi:MAG: 50S ribosomal protein L15 [candidate division SR1 bacterium]|nr:MAG: 50S ribosomal protein L15 [candidate division SR1 bacterium]
MLKKRNSIYSYKARRIGRGNASKGNTSGKGNKGQKARSGGSISPFFEGGQTPLVQRMPKSRGFKRPIKLQEVYAVVNLADLEKNENITSEVTKEVLQEAGYIKKTSENVKVLGNGTLTKKLVFSGIEKFSQSAMDKITKAGGEVK